MGGIQAGRILGIAFGSVVSTVAANNQELDLDQIIDWKIAFIISATSFLLIGISWFRLDNRFLDNQYKKKEEAKHLVE